MQGAALGLAAAALPVIGSHTAAQEATPETSVDHAPVIGRPAATHRSPPASPTAPLAASAYLGTFANDYVGPVVIRSEDDALSLHMGPKPRAHTLTHFERDTFTDQIDLESPAPLTGATFVIGPDGRAEADILPYFAGNG